MIDGSFDKTDDFTELEWSIEFVFKSNNLEEYSYKLIDLNANFNDHSSTVKSSV